MTHPLSWRAPAQQKTPPGALPYFRGPFTCQMAFTMPLKLGAQIPDRLFATLLICGPDSDGNGYQEIEGGWPRLPVRVVGRAASLLAIDHPLLFDVPAQEVASLGLFDSPDPGGGALWFYGALRATRASSHPENRFEFPAYSVLLKRPPAGLVKRASMGETQ